MGNHECTGATASNCGPGQDGTTGTYAAFLSTMLAPIGQKEPYYAMQVNATDGSWTAKFVFVAANAWSDAQGTWLEAKLSIPTTYTFVVRHEPARVTEAPGVAPSEAIMAKHPYTIAIVGHSHTFRRESAKEVIVGNGGAPLTGRTNYGYGIFELQKDGQVAVDMVDYQTLVPEPDQHFTVGP